MRKSPTAPTADQWATARQAWEEGATNPEAAKLIGVTRETVRKRAIAEGWVKNDGAAAERAAELRAQTEKARLTAERKWANRRADEADAVGLTAAKARQAVVAALDRHDEKMVRAAAIAYGIFIDKAQLLSGDATARIDGPSAHDRAVNILDELAARRESA